MVFLLGECSPSPPWDGVAIFPPDHSSSADSLLLFNIASLSLLRSSLTQLPTSSSLADAINRTCTVLSRIIEELRLQLDRLSDATTIAAVAKMLTGNEAGVGQERGEVGERHASGSSSQAVALRICYLLHLVQSVARMLAVEGDGASLGQEMQRVMASVQWCCQLSAMSVAVAFCPPPQVMNPSLHAMAMSLITDFASQTARVMVQWSLTHSPPPESPFPLWAPLWSLPSSLSRATPHPSSAATPVDARASHPGFAPSPPSKSAANAVVAAGSDNAVLASPLRCSSAGGTDPLSSAAAARAYTDYYLAAFSANVCECIAAAARSNKALLQQAHMRALTDGAHSPSPPPLLHSSFSSHDVFRCRRDLRSLAHRVRARLPRGVRCAH